MTETTLTSFPATAAPATGFADVAKLFRTWQNRSRGRRQLARMSGHELSDIGLTRGDQHFETMKPFWKA